MQIVNLLASLILIASATFIFAYKKFTIAFKIHVIFALCMILLLHFMVVSNMELFGRKEHHYDRSFQNDLKGVKNQQETLHKTPGLTALKSCRD